MELAYVPKNLALEPTFEDILISLKETAKNNGVVADFFDHDKGNPDNPISGTYFVVCSDVDPMLELKRNPDKLGEIITQNNKRGPHMINPYYATVKIPEINNENYFIVHNEMCQAIQNLAIVRNAFYEFGYTLPDAINQGTIDSIYKFYLKGHNDEMPEALQEIYRDSYKKYVSEMNQLYNKKSFKFLKKKWFKTHRVSADYFINNSVPVAYLVVSEDFLKYLESRISECPDFVYYKEPRPWLHLKDLSKKYKGPEQWNYWKDYTEVRKYNIGYPLECHPFLNKMAIEYMCRNFEQKVDRGELEKSTKHPLLRINLREEDMWNFNSLCLSNNVKFSIDYDNYDATNGDLNLDPTILYRKEDKEMVTRILSRLAREMRGHIPTDSEQRAAAEQNKPKEVKNPYLQEI